MKKYNILVFTSFLLFSSVFAEEIPNIAKRDYYEILGVARDATEEDVRRAFRKQAMEWHPDRNKSTEETDRFKEVNEAYQVLVDPLKCRHLVRQRSQSLPNVH